MIAGALRHAAILALVGLTGLLHNGASALAQAGDPIEIELNQGHTLRLARPAAAVFLAEPEIADVQVLSPRLVFVLGRRAGTTSLFAVARDDSTILETTVRVTHSIDRLERIIREVAPDAEVSARSVDGAIVLSGSVRSPEEAADIRTLAERFVGGDETLVNRLSVVAPTQVNLRVRVAEVAREVTKELGINWSSVFQSGNFAFGIFTGRQALGAQGQLLRAAGGADSAAGRFRAGGTDLNAVIDALERERLVTILAEPNLTALSGETASFLAGGEFPIPVGQRDREITIQFKQFGVSLSFTPVVLSDDRISLKVRPEVSELSEAGAIRVQDLEIQAITTRRAETTVELASGQSFAIAGLLQNRAATRVDRFPGLGDIPILGALFRSSRFQRNESELVIIVTPYTVQPVSSPDMLPLPIDGFVAASDLERIFLGRLVRGDQRAAADPRVLAGQRLAGPVGFILD